MKKLKWRKSLLLSSLTVLGLGASAVPFIAVSCDDTNSGGGTGGGKTEGGSQDGSQNSQNSVEPNIDVNDSLYKSYSPDLQSYYNAKISKSKSDALKYWQGKQTVASLKKWSTSYNTDAPNRAFIYEGSRGYGSLGNAASLSETSTLLVRMQGLNQATYETKLVIDDGKPTTQILITRPSYWRYTLDGAKAILVTKNDGSVVVFDNDEVDSIDKQKPVMLADGIHFRYMDNQATSSNDRSINSQHFKDVLKDAKSMQFVVREYAWVDGDGKDSGTKTKAEDYYVSFVRTVANSKGFRLENGGTESLDKIINEISTRMGSPDIYGEKSKYPNAYIYQAFGIDLSALLDKSKAITKTQTSEAQYNNLDAYTFSLVDGATEPNFYGLFEQVAKSFEWSAAPSDWIKQNTNNIDASSPYWGNLESDEKTQLESALKDSQYNSLAKEAGIYWYGITPKATLYSGRYLPTKTINSTELRKNHSYWNQNWVNSGLTIDTIVENYNLSQNPEAFKVQQYNQYKEGSTSAISYSSLTSAQQSEFTKDIWGYRYNQSRNLKTWVARDLLSAFPTNLSSLVKDLKSDKKYTDQVPGWQAKYPYNDAYAKLMYGASLEDIANGNVKDVTSFIAGSGLEFRTLTNAALNWRKIAFTVSPNAREWLVRFAQDTPFGGTNQAEWAAKDEVTPRDKYNEINALYAVDKDGNKLGLNDNNSSITPKDNENAILKVSDDLDQYKSAAYDKVKVAVKALLDKFYAENNLSNDVKVSWELIYPYSNISANDTKLYENVQKTLNSLDSRLDVKFNATIGNWTEVQYPKLVAAGLDIVGWGYDYQTIGSGFDAYSWMGSLLPTLYEIATKPELQASLQKAFPHLVELSKELKKFYDDNKSKFSNLLDADKWWNTALKEGRDYYSKFGDNIWTFSYQFWQNINSTSTNEKLLALANEVSVFTGPSLDGNMVTARSAFIPYLASIQYDIPRVGTDYVYIADYKLNK
ncbi:OppA family ABC transporter substrate-binding lipoprotein [Mycoplasma sp. 128]